MESPSVYAELDKDLNVIGEFPAIYVDVEQIPDLGDDLGPSLRPIVLVCPSFSPTQKLVGPKYEVAPDHVKKVFLVVPKSKDEIEQETRAAIVETRTAAIPNRDELVETIVRVLLGVVETLAMVEDPADLRTKVLVNRLDCDNLRNVLKILEANPVK